MVASFRRYTKCSQDLQGLRSTAHVDAASGFFKWSDDLVLYGRSEVGAPYLGTLDQLADVSNLLRRSPKNVTLPFCLDDVSTNLRLEKYARNQDAATQSGVSIKTALHTLYYSVRPLLPVGLRKHLQRVALAGWDKIAFPQWPVDCTVETLMKHLWRVLLELHGATELPFIWFWPEDYFAAGMMTHDVETAVGRDFCGRIMEIEDLFGVRSSFEVVPEERYEVPPSFLDEIRNHGCEACLHGLNHDGHLFRSEAVFRERAARINAYAEQFGARGFRSPVMYRRPEWFDSFDFTYDMSFPNVAHLDPQRGGCCTVMPFFIGDLVELPLTTIQDYSLFHILNDYTIDLWKQQIKEIVTNHGLVSFIVHPDYVREERALETFRALLGYLTDKAESDRIWLALPGEIAGWWRTRDALELVDKNGRVRIEGNGSDRARVAYACLEGDDVIYRRDPR